MSWLLAVFTVLVTFRTLHASHLYICSLACWSFLHWSPFLTHKALRKLVEQRKHVERRREKRDIIKDYTNFDSQVYAPMTRIGVFLDAGSEQYNLQSNYNTALVGEWSWEKGSTSTSLTGHCPHSACLSLPCRPFGSRSHTSSLSDAAKARMTKLLPFVLSLIAHAMWWLVL